MAATLRGFASMMRVHRGAISPPPSEPSLSRQAWACRAQGRWRTALASKLCGSARRGGGVYLHRGWRRRCL